jgi:8-oxo-dGTP pyrophosphatase MutT (NUDIX family)
MWALPKGTPEDGESREQTALREASEETGLDVVAERFIGSIDYWFVRPGDGARCHKTVYYYMMSANGGDTARHDGEFDRVAWFPVREALMLMTYKNEVEVVEKGLPMASD